MYKLSSYYFMILSGLGCSSTFANPAIEKDENPLHIVADVMECDQKTNICTATGGAFAQKLKDPAKQTIRASKFIVHFEKKPDGTKTSNNPASETATTEQAPTNARTSPELSKLKKIEAIGDVVITDEDSVIRCDTAIYYADTDTAELFDNVSLTKGRNQMEGDYAHADLKTSKYNVQSEEGPELPAMGLFYEKSDVKDNE